MAIRTRLPVEQRREQVLEAAMGLFAEQPFEQLSMDQIASACGISRALLYHYFGGKRELYVETIRAASGRLAAQRTDRSRPEDEQLRQGLREYFGSVRKAPAAHVAFRRAAATDPEIAAIVARTREAFAQRVAAAIPGAADSPLALAAIRSWVAAVEAAAGDWIVRGEPAIESLVEVLAGALFGAIGAASRLDPSIVPPEADPEPRG
jgi:AcrR family transcriptional regulator